MAAIFTHHHPAAQQSLWVGCGDGGPLLDGRQALCSLLGARGSHIWRLEIADGCDISCPPIWQEIFHFAITMIFAQETNTLKWQTEIIEDLIFYFIFTYLFSYDALCYLQINWNTTINKSFFDLNSHQFFFFNLYVNLNVLKFRVLFTIKMAFFYFKNKNKRKTRNYKTPRGEHRQDTLRHTSQQDPLWPTSQNIGNNSKNKQMGSN